MTHTKRVREPLDNVYFPKLINLRAGFDFFEIIIIQQSQVGPSPGVSIIAIANILGNHSWIEEGGERG